MSPRTAEALRPTERGSRGEGAAPLPAPDRAPLDVAERSRAVFERGPDALFVIDATTGEIVDANRQAETLTGRPRARLIGARYDEIAATASRAELGRMVAELRRTSRAVAQARLSIARPDGSRLSAAASVTTAKKRGRRLAFAFVRDVGAQEALEDRLRRAERLEAVGRLAGGVAHDFNNFLTALFGALDAAEEARDPAEAAAALRQARAAAQSSAALTKQLMAFARRQPTARRRVEAGEAVRKLLPILRLVVGDSVRLTLDVAAGVGAVLADDSDLERVLVNLATNARDAMPCGGSIAIDVANRRLAVGEADLPSGDYVAVDVADDGLGMDAATQARLFEPFFTTKGAQRGTGLGLATCYAVVRRLGGTISVRSAPGAGTTMTVLLPRAGERGDAQHVRREAPRGRGETVLFVEDDVAIRTQIAPRLAAAGYRVVEAEDGLAGLLAFQRLPRVDAVVTDVVMPCLSGDEMVRELRRRGADVPALLVSGYAEEAVDADELDARTAFLRKPYTVAELALTVRRLIDARAAAAARAAEAESPAAASDARV